MRQTGNNNGHDEDWYYRHVRCEANIMDLSLKASQRKKMYFDIVVNVDEQTERL